MSGSGSSSRRLPTSPPSANATGSKTTQTAPPQVASGWNITHHVPTPSIRGNESSTSPQVVSHLQAPITADSDGQSSSYKPFDDDDTQSIRSSVVNYIFENGRRYHRYVEGRYVLPNDETEQDRLDLHHHIFLLLLDGRTHLAPVRNPKRILDVGTGTGIWALDVAEAFPDAEVIGTDLSAIQPELVLPNCRFEIDDAEEEWLYPPNHFDFVHSRTLGQSIRDWPRYLEQMYKHTAPGGYVELVEIGTFVQSDDGTLPPDCHLVRLCERFAEAEKKSGLLKVEGNSFARMVQRAGFQNVELFTFKQPWNGWPADPKLKHIGRVMLLSTETGLEAYCLAMLTRVLGMSTSETVELVANGLKDARNRKIHCFNTVHHVVARKPL